MGSVVHVDFGRKDEVALTKRQVAMQLRRSRRWVELRVREGMPSWLEGNRRMFRLSEARSWLLEHEFAAGAAGGPPGRKIEADDTPDPDDTGEGDGGEETLAPVIA